MKRHLSLAVAGCLFASCLVLAQADEMDDADFMDMGDTTEVSATEDDDSVEEEGFWSDFSGKTTQQLGLSYSDKRAQDIFASLRSTLFLTYAHKFSNDYKIKLTGRAFYDGKYDTRNGVYTQEQIDELRTEVRLFEAYVEGSILDNVDFKIGRQIVVWGRSDMIRINDILNPMDNRRPGILDIEDLRLPVGMAKVDIFLGDWRLSPIVIFEQNFTLDPPFGSAYNVTPANENTTYTDPTYALSINGEFSGWDISFYASRMRDSFGYATPKSLAAYASALKNGTKKPKIEVNHYLINMGGAAFNAAVGPWLFKSEVAYIDSSSYNAAIGSIADIIKSKSFANISGITNYQRLDTLVGFEYTGISDMFVSYDLALRHFVDYDKRFDIITSLYPVEPDTWQHALRINRDWVNSTVHTSYLVSLFGANATEGGYHRVNVKYDLADGINANLGVVQYFGGSVLFDEIKDQVIVMSDISYNF